MRNVVAQLRSSFSRGQLGSRPTSSLNEQLLKDIPDCSDYIAYPAPYTFMQQWAAAHLRKSKASESQVKESVLFAWRLAYDNYPTWRASRQRILANFLSDDVIKTSRPLMGRTARDISLEEM